MTIPSLYHRILMFLVMACTATYSGQAQPTPDASPNIVFIFVDDMGYGDLQCYGATDINTPNIDRIAEHGIRFTEFYSASPVCSPSRYGLMTGRYPVRDGIQGGVFFPESWTGMDTTEVTMAQLLKQQGYATGIIGKWHLGHRRQYLPRQRGFDEYFGIPYSNDMEAVAYLHNNDVVDQDVDQHQNVQTYTQKALRFIKDHQDGPFFLYLPHNMPHVPIYASDRFEGTSKRGLYGDVIQEIDWSVGQIMDTLSRLGLAENTLVVFTSDNGPWLTMAELGGSPGALRSGKQTTFEGGMRVPCVLQWPAQVSGGRVVDGMCTMMDWFPTFAHLTGATVPTDRPIDGEDITSVLLGTGERAGKDLAYYSVHTGEIAAFRSGDWKLKLPMERPYQGRYGYAGEPAHGTLLFNLKDDPGEKTNLAEQQPEKVQELQQKIAEFKQALGPVHPSQKFRVPADKSHEEYLKKKYAREK